MELSEIKNVSVYTSAYDIFKEEDDAVIESIDEDGRIALMHFDDFDGYRYIVLNNSSVIVTDGCSGDVYATFDSIESFWKATQTILEDLP